MSAPERGEVERLRILAVITGAYGRRHVANVQEHGPTAWSVTGWQPPAPLPPMIDDPDEFVPDTLAAADLILSFAETATVALLIPEVVRVTGARAVIAGVDNEAWLPRGLARQLRGWLGEVGVACVTPKPLCSLTTTDYGASRGERVPYQDEVISEFADWFGEPQLRLSIDASTRTVTAVEVVRDSVCGNARFVAERLVGISTDTAAEEAGLLHHHYPCLAGMEVDADFHDTLMHVSGNTIREGVAEQIRRYPVRPAVAPTIRGDDRTHPQAQDGGNRRP